MDAQRIWQAALGQLQLQLSPSTFETWLSHARGLSWEDGVLVVGVHNAYAKDWLENRLYGAIQEVVSKVARRTAIIRFIVHRNGDLGASKAELLEGALPSDPPKKPAADARERARVVPQYTFSSFIVGQSNRLAHAGCLAVSESPGLSYNPLFVYGGVGLGKTHLLHAIGNRVLEDGKQTLYVSAETFANELINAIRTQMTDDFRARYRTIDVLLLDDVQFLIGKERTQEEFFHTYNDLYQSSKQIVLSSDRPPKAFVGLEERLRSRFEWGLAADIQPPDLETRMAIVVAKSEARSVQLPHEVVEFIAYQVQSNIRELEGALNRVLAYARMMGYPLTAQTAQQALSSDMRPTTKVGLAEIIAIVAGHFGLTPEDLTGRRRTQDIALARQVAMYLARELTEESYPQIGKALGGRDHTTVLHGCDKISALFERDDGLRREILAIRTRLYGER
ncbi:MAG: chromosomal replication initiator protein DnaA, partial [Chloroflexi bacterium]|nr:chromosomal replication initiator protein DnaA [Chloroflexota bacterium]